MCIYGINLCMELWDYTGRGTGPSRRGQELSPPRGACRVMQCVWVAPKRVLCSQNTGSKQPSENGITFPFLLSSPSCRTDVLTYNHDLIVRHLITPRGGRPVTADGNNPGWLWWNRATRRVASRFRPIFSCPISCCYPIFCRPHLLSSSHLLSSHLLSSHLLISCHPIFCRLISSHLVLSHHCRPSPQPCPPHMEEPNYGDGAPRESVGLGQELDKPM